MTPVMLVVIDLVRHFVLLPIDLRLLLLRQLAAVGGAVGADFLIDGRFFLLKIGSFAGGELSALHAVRDAVLLIFRALADFTLGIAILHSTIVLVLINLLRKLVLLLRQGLLVGGGQLAVIKLAHIALFLVQCRFFLFQILGFAGRQFAVLHAVTNAILL